MSFLHWRYPAEVIRPLLPDGLAVHTCDGDAWVGLLPFVMDEVRLPGMPPLPWLSRFPETNLRTYVRGPGGHSGIWFFSLDAARLPAVAGARLGLGLPYFWSDMKVTRRENSLVYRGQRRLSGPQGVGYHIEVGMGEAYRDDELTPLDHFLTARYRLYSAMLGRWVAVDVEHPPWPLHRAEVVKLRQNLTQAAGLPDPTGTPLVHASPGVRVRIGVPRKVSKSVGPGGTSRRVADR